jgi:DNA-binding LytR/AlgR family response regulator
MIVISGDAGRVLRSYRWHPAAFLKPDFDQGTFADALRECEKHWRRGRLCLESPARRRPFRLPLGPVRYVEAAAHYCVFDQGRRSVRLRYSIDELEKLLPLPPFVRCHRSYLVRLDAVEHMSYTAAALRGGENLPLGRKYVGTLRARLEAWREGEPC